MAGKLPSRSLLEEQTLGTAARGALLTVGLGVAEVSIGVRRRDPPARRALQEAVLYEEGLVYLFDCRHVLTDRRADVVEADRSAVEFLDDRLENSRIHVVETKLVHVDHSKELASDLAG